MARDSTKVGYRSTRMGAGMEEATKRGGGIVPGANKQYENPPALGNPVKQVGQAFSRLRGKFGKKRSPSHVGGD